MEKRLEGGYRDEYTRLQLLKGSRLFSLEAAGVRAHQNTAPAAHTHTSTRFV